jgi:AmmeMemoRadiSam system protein B
MMVSEKLGADRAKLLKYANSGDVTGDRKSVVGYASAIFYKGRDS